MEDEEIPRNVLAILLSLRSKFEESKLFPDFHYIDQIFIIKFQSLGLKFLYQDIMGEGKSLGLSYCQEMQDGSIMNYTKLWKIPKNVDTSQKIFELIQKSIKTYSGKVLAIPF